MLRGVSFGSTRKGTFTCAEASRRRATAGTQSSTTASTSATGKKRRRWVAAGTRRSDAERVLADLIRRKYDGEPVPTERLTVAEYLTQRWLPIQKSRVRPSTYDAYRRNVDQHVASALGRRPLDKLTAEDIDLFYAALLTEGRKGTGGESAGLAPKTVRNIHVMLNKALADAQRKGIVVRNVVALADAPTLKGRRRGEIKAWDAGRSECSSTRSARTVCTRRSTCPLTPRCAVVRCSGCAGATSTSRPAGCRCARRWCPSRTTYSSRT